MKFQSLAKLSSLACCVWMAGAWASPISSVWVGGSGSWSDSSKWVTPPGAPQAGYQVLIDNGNPLSSLVTVDVATAALNNLAVDSGDAVVLNQNLTAGTVRSFGGVTINNGAVMNAGAGGFVQDQASAATVIGAGGQLQDSGSYSQGNGSTTVSGSLTTDLFHVTGGAVTVQNGGSAVIGSGGYTQDNGVATAVNAGGQMSMTGSYSQGSGSTLVGGTLSTALLHVTGGTVEVTGGGSLSVGSGGYTQGVAGTATTIDSGGSVAVTGGDYSQEAGTSTLVNGQLSASTIRNSGTITGDGTLTGNVIDLGTLNPDENTMNVVGSYAQSGFLDMGIAGPGSNGLLVVSGAASLGGSLSLDLANGFVPVLGSKFLVMTYSSLSGGFSTVQGGGLSAGEFWQAIYDPNDLYVTVATANPTPEPGTLLLFAMGLAVAVMGRRQCKFVR